MNNTDNAKLKKYVIVYQDNGYGEYNRDIALYFQMKLSEIGIDIPIVSDAEEPVAHEILIGHTNRPESEAAYTGVFAPELMHYTVDLVGEKYVLAGYEWFSTKKSVDKALSLISVGKAIEDGRTRNCPMNNGFPDRAGKYRALHYNVMVEWVNWGCGGILEGPIYKRREPLTALVQGYAPDFICFCEVFERWAATFPELFGDQYSFIHLDRTDNNASNRTPLAYNRKKFRLIEGGYENIGIVPTTNMRVMTWGLMEDRENGKKILVCGTHWESYPNEGDRQKQATMCSEIIKQKAQQYQVEVIFMGDFNTNTGYPAYNQLVSDSGLLDAEGDQKPKWCVDHIFVSENIKVRSCRREDGKFNNYASDHPPVICDFDF